MDICSSISVRRSLPGGAAASSRCRCRLRLRPVAGTISRRVAAPLRMASMIAVTTESCCASATIPESVCSASAARSFCNNSASGVTPTTGCTASLVRGRNAPVVVPVSRVRQQAVDDALQKALQVAGLRRFHLRRPSSTAGSPSRRAIRCVRRQAVRPSFPYAIEPPALLQGVPAELQHQGPPVAVGHPVDDCPHVPRHQVVVDHHIYIAGLAPILADIASGRRLTG